MNCRKCNDKLPQVRVDLGYKDCVSCSTVEAVSCVDITYHKTGNTIQVMDKETADKVNKLAQRSGYGIMRGLRSGATPKSTTKIIGNSGRSMRMPTQEDFQQAGKQAMYLSENKDKQSALKYIDNALESRMISGSHRRQLREILDTFSPDPVVEYNVKETVIDQEIEFAFRNWKNSKVYR